MEKLWVNSFYESEPGENRAGKPSGVEFFLGNSFSRQKSFSRHWEHKDKDKELGGRQETGITLKPKQQSLRD